MLMHAAVNNTKDVVPSQVLGAANPFALSTSLIAWLSVALLWVCAAYFLLRLARQRDHRDVIAGGRVADVGVDVLIDRREHF